MINELLKDKRQKISTLPLELQDILTKGRTDPVVFITHLLGMPLHQGQIRYLRAVQSNKYRKFVLVPANRYGKSTLISCLQIWYLFYKFGIPPGNRTTWFKAEYRTANIAPHSSL